MSFKIFLKIAAALVAVALAAVAVVLKYMDFNDYKGMIAAQAKSATGRDLVINGDAQLALSFTPALVANNVSFSNAPWGSRPEMAKFKRIEAVVQLIPLFSGNVLVDRIILISPDILLETNADGTGNWVFGKGEAGKSSEKPEGAPSKETEGKPAIPLAREIRIENGLLEYRDGIANKTISLSLEKLKGLAQGVQSPISLEVSGAYANRTFEADARLGAIEALTSMASPFPVELEARLFESTLKINGTVKSPLEGKGLDMAISIQGKELAKSLDAANLPRMAGKTVQDIGPFEVSARLTDPTGAGYSLSDVKVRIGREDLELGKIRMEGKASFQLQGKRPRLHADLSSVYMNVDELSWPKGKEHAASEAHENAAQQTGQRRVFSNAPFSLESLKAADVSLKVAGGLILAQGLEFKDLFMDLSLEGGNLEIRSLKSGIAGGTLSADAALDGRKPVAALKAKIELKKIDIASALKGMKATDLVSSGKADMEAELNSAGRSLRELMAGLNGKVNLAAGEGTIENKYLDFAAADLIKLITTGGGKKDQTAVNCFVCGFDVQNGLASSRGILLDTEQITVAGEGNVNLADETLHLTLNPRPKEKSLLSLAVPVNIRGSIAEPLAFPDTEAVAKGVAGAILGQAAMGPAGLLVPLVSKGAGEKNPCLEALSKKGKQPIEQPASSQAPENIQKEKMEEKVKDILKGLEGIFK